MIRTLRRFLMAGVVALAATSSARADFDIQLFTDATLTTQISNTIVDQGFGDSNLTADQISVSGADLANLNGDIATLGLQFTSLGATSNNLFPPANGIANLTVTGNVTRTDANGPATIFVLVSADGYSFPPGPNYAVGSSASHTFTNVGAGTSPAFTSFFNQNNVLNATQTPTATLVFAPPAGTSSAGLTAPDLFTPGTPLYSLTNVTRLTLSGLNASDQFTGTTTVRAVPEPGSLALVILGASGLIARQVRRRKSQA